MEYILYSGWDICCALDGIYIIFWMGNLLYSGWDICCTAHCISCTLCEFMTLLTNAGCDSFTACALLKDIIYSQACSHRMTTEPHVLLCKGKSGYGRGHISWCFNSMTSCWRLGIFSLGI